MPKNQVTAENLYEFACDKNGASVRAWEQLDASERKAWLELARLVRVIPMRFEPDFESAEDKDVPL